MTTKKAGHYIILFIMFFSFANIARASFEITEIMYDQEGTDANREWVEVKNVGTSPEDLSKWFLFSDNAKHALVPQSESIIPAGSYAVIVQNVPQFNLDNPAFQGALFDSSWTGFNNTTESISLKDADLNIVSPVTYTSGMGGAGNGNSLSKINDSWQNGIPTPGKDNQAVIVIRSTETKKPIQKDLPATKIVKTLTSSQSGNIEEDYSGEGKEVINLNGLEASVGGGDINVSNSALPFIGLLVIIGLGITSFLFIKKKNNNSEKITAEDMTIVE